MDDASVNEISVDELREALTKSCRLVDVREPDEYAAGHVPGAVSIPLGQVPARLAEIVADGGPIFMICRSGARSENACRLVRESGHRAINVAGGTMAWIVNGHDVVEGDNPQ